MTLTWPHRQFRCLFSRVSLLYSLRQMTNIGQAILQGHLTGQQVDHLTAPHPPMTALGNQSTSTTRTNLTTSQKSAVIDYSWRFYTFSSGSPAFPITQWNTMATFTVLPSTVSPLIVRK